MLRQPHRRERAQRSLFGPDHWIARLSEVAVSWVHSGVGLSGQQEGTWPPGGATRCPRRHASPARHDAPSSRGSLGSHPPSPWWRLRRKRSPPPRRSARRATRSPVGYPGRKTPWTRTYRASICFSNGTSSSVDVSLRALRRRGFSPTFPPTGSLDGDYFYDPQICRPDGADDGSVADSCAAATSNYNFSIGPGDTFCMYVFWRGVNSGQGDLCFDYTYDDGFSTTEASACTSVKFSSDCGCSSPQPPYASDTDKVC